MGLGDTSNAMLKYQAAASNNNNKIKSIAYQQLGVMADKPETLNESLQYLKSALKADPSNEEARFNYELVKKKLEKQKEQQQDQQNQDKQDGEQKEGDQEEKQQQEQEGEEKPDESKDNQEMSTKEKLEQMNISEEKAKMILEAMKNNEIQYIQQQRRKPTKATDSSKPD